MSIRPVVRGAENGKTVEFWLEQDGDEINLLAEDGWYVLSIKPGEDGLLEMKRHDGLPEDIFEVEGPNVIREA